MKRAQLVEKRREEFSRLKYRRVFWSFYDYSFLDKILTIRKPGRGTNESYNEIIIAADTETSKKKPNDTYIENGKIKTNSYANHVVLWTITLRAYGYNLVTLYGRTPRDMIRCIERIKDNMRGDKTIIFFHNYPFDYTFLRKFMFERWGFPEKILNIKPHYPLNMEFPNGLVFRDSLALAQRSLDKWSKDLQIEHSKKTGDYNYKAIRNQNSKIPDSEITYAEYDTLALAECIDVTMNMLNKRIYSLPLTATGIVREDVRKEGMKHSGHEDFLRCALTYEQYLKCCKVYHGGYTHANRHKIGEVINMLVECYDFASSYPYCMIAYKYPRSKFIKTKDCKVEKILKYKEKYAFMFKLVLVGYSIKTDQVNMPPISVSKCEKIINPVTDNGRVLSADYIELYTNEVDLEVIDKYSKYQYNACVDVEYCIKSYLPRWFTDLVYHYFELKTTLKTSTDFIAYMLAKAKLNSLYGLCVQKSIQEIIAEDYETGEYNLTDQDERAVYEKYCNKKKTVLNYQTGCWVTSYAMRNLFTLCNECTDQNDWAYSDTDSGYSTKWNKEAIKAFNNNCIKLVALNGYGPVEHEGRLYHLGVAEHDGDKDTYTEFVTLGAKRYCGRQKKDGKLHITVAGVPKKGAECLKDDIKNFRKGFIFDGKTTGKKTHAYIYADKIYIDDNGNQTGDSIDLYECDYLADEVNIDNWIDYANTKEYALPLYDEGRI